MHNSPKFQFRKQWKTEFQKNLYTMRLLVPRHKPNDSLTIGLWHLPSNRPKHTWKMKQNNFICFRFVTLDQKDSFDLMMFQIAIAIYFLYLVTKGEKKGNWPLNLRCKCYKMWGKELHFNFSFTVLIIHVEKKGKNEDWASNVHVGKHRMNAESICEMQFFC